jgi:outer membrane cobalamin receptor
VGFFASRLFETVAFQGMRYENAGELAPRGIEVQSEWRVGSGSLLGSYQYLFKTSAEHRASLTLRGPAEKRFTPEVQLSAVSERRDPFLGAALSAYGLVGGGVTAKLSAVAKLSLRVENLLNTAYQESYGYGTRGITVWLGVQVAQL